MRKLHAVFLLLLVGALGAACEPTYPQTDDATAADATGTDATAVADAATDTWTAKDAADVPLSDAAPADVPTDTPPPDVPDTVADAQSDAVSDVQSDAVSDVQADAVDAGGDVVVLPVSATNIDVVGLSWACTGTALPTLATCSPTELSPALLPGIHVDLPFPITYTDVPPSSGTHRPVWGKWGEYVFLPEQRWLHNLEHGSIAFLYNPCAPQTVVDALRAVAKSQPADNSGPFRWVMTPYPGLPSAVALLSWGHIFEADCVDPTAMAAFIAAHYRKAPEDEASPGAYEELWLHNWP